MQTAETLLAAWQKRAHEDETELAAANALLKAYSIRPLGKSVMPEIVALRAKLAAEKQRADDNRKLFEGAHKDWLAATQRAEQAESERDELQRRFEEAGKEVRSPFSTDERKEIDNQRGLGMTSAVGEYTPAEFWTLLDAYDTLRQQHIDLLARAKKDAERWKFYEDQHTLHWRLEVTYVVDGYEFSKVHENGITVEWSFKGDTLLKAIDAALEAGAGKAGT